MVKLDYLKREDLAKIYEWNTDKSADFILQWAGPTFSYPITYKQIEDYYLVNTKNDNNTVYDYKIQLDYTDEIIGTIELRETDKLSRTGRVCRFLIGKEDFRGKGIGAQVLKEILKIGFEDLKFEKITLGVFDFNFGAIKCYENAGFKREKLIENARKASDGYWNLYEMCILKSEWQGKKQ